MKNKLLLFFVFLVHACLAIASTAQPTHSVTASSLNVREGARMNSNKIGILTEGDKIYVTGYIGAWAEIEYREVKAYVGLRYIQPIENTGRTFWGSLSLPKKQTVWSNVLMWSLVVLLIGLSVLRYSREGEVFEDFELMLYALVFLLACFAEAGIGYLLYNGYEIYLFGLDYNHHQGSIYKFVAKAFILAVAFVFLIYNQLKSFLNILNDLEYNSSHVNYFIYKYSTLLSIIAGIITFFFFYDYLVFVIMFWCVCTLLQILLIMAKTFPQWEYGFTISIVMLVGSITFIIMGGFLVWAYIANRVLKLVNRVELNFFKKDG